MSEDLQTISNFCGDVNLEIARQRAEQESKDKSKDKWKVDVPPFLTDPVNWIKGAAALLAFVGIVALIRKLFRGGGGKKFGPTHIPPQQFDIAIDQLRGVSSEVEKQPWYGQLYLAKLAIEQSRKAHGQKLSLVGELPKEDVAAFAATHMQPEKLAEHKQSAAHWMPIKIDDAWEKLPDSIRQEFGPGWKSGRPSVLIFSFMATPEKFPFNPMTIVERASKAWKPSKGELLYHGYNLHDVMATLVSTKPELAFYPGLVAFHGMSIIDGWRNMDSPGRGIFTERDNRSQTSKAFVPVNYVVEWHRIFIKKANKPQTAKVQETKPQAALAEVKPEVSKAQAAMSLTPAVEVKPETGAPAQSPMMPLSKLEPEGPVTPAQVPQTIIAEEKPKTAVQEKGKGGTVVLKPKRARKDSTRVATPIPVDEFGDVPEQRLFSGAELVVVDTEGILNHIRGTIIKIEKLPDLKNVLFGAPSPLLLDIRRLWPEEFRQKPLSFQLYAEFYVSMTWKSDSTLNQNTKPHDDYIRKIWETFKDYSLREENLVDAITFARRQLANEWDKLSSSIKREFSSFSGVPQYAFDILDNVPKDDAEVFSIRSLSPASTPWKFDPPKQSMEGINPDAVKGALVEENKELASYPHLLEILKSLVIESWMALDPATQQAISPDLYVQAWHDMLLAEIEKSIIMKRGPDLHLPPSAIVTDFDEKAGDPPPSATGTPARQLTAAQKLVATAQTVVAKPGAVIAQPSLVTPPITNPLIKK